MLLHRACLRALTVASRTWVHGDLLNVQVDAVEAGSTLTIVDATGRSVRDQRMTNSLEQIHIGDLTPGTYLARLQTTNGRGAIKRFVITR